MNRMTALLADYWQRQGAGLPWPEYRSLEMYGGKPQGLSQLPVLPAVEADGVDPALVPHLVGPWQLLHLLEADFMLRGLVPLEGQTSWQHQLALPRQDPAQKLVAEGYRVLRMVRIALCHPQGQLKGVRDRQGRLLGLSLGCNANAYPVQCGISLVGLALLQSMSLFYLQERDGGRVGPAYLQAMLLSYYTDLVAEIHEFEDEDRALCQFHSGLGLNRHERLECRNPRFLVEAAHCLIQLAPRFADGVVRPIDFFLHLNDGHYRVPMEALVALPGRANPCPHAIPLAALTGWQITAAATPVPPHCLFQ